MNAPVNIGVIFIDYLISIGKDVNLNIFIINVLNVISLLHNSCPFVVYFWCNTLFRQKFYSLVGLKSFMVKSQVYSTNLHSHNQKKSNESE